MSAVCKLQLSQILKQIHQRKGEKVTIYFLMWRYNNQKIHLGAHLIWRHVSHGRKQE